jgi:hypothetical protein
VHDARSGLTTIRLTDAGPTMSDCQRRRDPGVRCSRLVRRCMHVRHTRQK